MRIGLGMSIVGGGYAPSGITYLSDVGGTPTAAYSVRKVVNGYSGSAIRVRESSGDTETDIGFDGENLDEAALLAHCGANDGFVTKWYDQSGNGYDAVQAAGTAQPKIVSAGTVIKENGLPALQPNDLTDFMSIASLAGNSNCWIFSTIKVTLPYSAIVYGDAGNEYPLIANDGSGVTLIYNNSGTPVYYKNGSTVTYATRDAVYDDLIAQSLFTISADTSLYSSLRIGSIDAGIVGMMQIQELIIYNSDKSSLRTDIEGNINGYYSIYP